MDCNSSCELVLLESNVPTPIAKKNTKGKILYGVFCCVVKTGTSDINNIMPPIKTKTALAFEIPFLDTKNKPTTSGNKNTTTKPSYLNCVIMLANAEIILDPSSDETLSTVKVMGSGIICVKIRTAPITTSAKYDDNDKIFFLLGKSDNAINGIVIGKSPIDSGCESIVDVKEIGEKNHLLKIRYIESR